jgi:pentose-5-phosphate-3-epimerase
MCAALRNFDCRIGMSFVVPAILPSSRRDLEERLALFSSIPGVSRIQIDVVDGKFAAPASWPYSAPGDMEAMIARGESLPEQNRLAYEIDLMCKDAEEAARSWIALGASRLTFHAASVDDIGALIASVPRRHSAGADFDSELISFGLAIDIGSDPALLESHVDNIEYVQFMGIANIGHQGEPFDERVCEQIRAFRARHAEMPLQVDGGVSLASAQKLVRLGVTNLIVGSALTSASDPIATFNALEGLQTPFGV